MRARSIVIASVLLGILAGPALSLAQPSSRKPSTPGVAVVDTAVSGTPVVQPTEHDRANIRLASLEPRDVLQSGDLLRNNTRRAAVLMPADPRTALGASAERTASSSMQRARWSATDFWLMGLVAAMLVIYQLRRKHRFLRPQPFSF